jgi:leucyl/phenylalanyl-tRNA---protein transferase
MREAAARARPSDPWDDVTLGPGGGVPVAIGGSLTWESVLGAYRRGVFCQPRAETAEIRDNERLYAPDVAGGFITVLPGAENPYSVLWWRPDTRYVLRPDRVHVGRTLNRTLRRSDWTTTVDRAFDKVLENCRAGRSPCWLTDDLVAALRELSSRGWLRSIEVWAGEDLVGGLFGCAFESVFVMDSAFRHRAEAAKVAIVDLARRGADCGIALLDAQVRSEYTVQLGAAALSRADYAAALGAGDQCTLLPTERRHSCALAGTPS